MKTLLNHRLIRALLSQPVDRTPVWMMRQAGRYLPEYRQLRRKFPDFMSFCKNPQMACEATLQPLRRFDLDAAIIFSDILTIPEAMGMKLTFIPGEGPNFSNPIRTMVEVNQLQKIKANQALDYVMEAIERAVDILQGEVPLIGFAGSPWTVACYMVEGRSSKNFQAIKTLLYRHPEILTALLERLTLITIDYLNSQIQAGAQAIMLFDTWGGILPKLAYQEFSLKYLTNIASNLQREKDGQTIPLTFFTKNGGQWLEMIANSGCDAIGLDWTIDIGDARSRMGERVALQGNLDPFILFSTPEKIKSEVQYILQRHGAKGGHVFNLGHGIDKETPIENVKVMIEAVHEFGKVT